MGPARAPACRPSRSGQRCGRRLLRGTRDQRGQSLVEFALVLTPLMLILLGIIQFGFIFNTYVTLTNATREAAREGSIYVYDRTLTKTQNDLVRNERIRTSLLASMNLLGKSAPQFANSSSWTVSGSTYMTGDLTVTYTIPSGIIDSEPRTGQRITVAARYHQDLIIPFIAELLPQDAGGRLVLTGEVTMVVN
jgi:Flp pilus assembly protein TadG